MYVKDFVSWIQSDKDFTFVDFDEDHREKIYPTNKLRLPVNKEMVLKTGLVAPEDADKILPYIDFTIDDYGITKNRIMMLDILANFNWEKPIYFTGGSYEDEEYLWLKDYLQMDGLTYKLVPIKTPYTGSPFEMGRINPEKMYKNVQKWNWGTITDGIYLDSETRKNSVNFRNSLARLSNAFAEKGDTVKAIQMLDLSLEKMPANKFYNHGMLMDYVDSYYRFGQKQKARALAEQIIGNTQEWLQYFSEFNDSYFPSIYDELENNLLLYGEVVKMTSKYDDKAYSEKAQSKYMEHLEMFKHLIDE
jgi:tetratricopeptide (TPR) repeat protein